MLKRLKAHNFGKHRDKEVFFTDGLNSIRGPNEGGKTTIGSEAIAYAFFGTEMLRESLADTVTTGEKEASMNVELDYSDYKIYRSKNTASVVGNGVKISGQKEVSEFFRELFGIKKGTERSVMIAEQGEIQGILAAKGNATAVKFIEDLAGFDQIDNIIETIKIKYPSGNISNLEDMKEEYEQTLQDLDEVDLPDVEAIDKSRAEAKKKVIDQELNRVGVEEGIAELNKELLQASKIMRDYEEVVKAVERLKRQDIFLNGEERSLQDAVNNIDTGKFKELKDLELLVSAAEEKNKMYHGYQSIKAIEETEDFWEGDRESLTQEYKKALKEISDLRTLSYETISDIKTQERRINDKDTCGECGQDIAHLHEEINKDARAKITVLEKTSEKRKKNLKEATSYGEVLSGLLLTDKDVRDNIQRISESLPDSNYISTDLRTVPRTVRWVGSIPESISSTVVKSAQDKIKQIIKYKTRLDGLQNQLKNALYRRKTAGKNLQMKRLELKNFIMPETPVEQIKADIDKSDAVKLELNSIIQVLRDEESEWNSDLLHAKGFIKSHEKSIATANDKIKSINKSILADQDNADLLKAVRAARPEVINKVWNLLLSATSGYFSLIRGTECDLSRDGKSFIVGDQKAGRLSGSTRDALGLALRAATIDVFAPTIDFMLLDEVAAGMDEDRTAAAMGMIASLPISQVVLCTHENVSDTLANNLIEC